MNNDLTDAVRAYRKAKREWTMNWPAPSVKVALADAAIEELEKDKSVILNQWADMQNRAMSAEAEVERLRWMRDEACRMLNEMMHGDELPERYKSRAISYKWPFIELESRWAEREGT